MREIKFRAWDIENKKIFGVVGYFMDSEIKKRIYILERYHGSKKNDITVNLPFDKVVIMQFTGLKDKNGKEIYEGDILRQWIKPLWKNEKGHWQIGKVFWKQEDRGLVAGKPILDEVEIELYDRSGMNVWFKDEVEIIGNIYENPELLNSKTL